MHLLNDSPGNPVTPLLLYCICQPKMLLVVPAPSPMLQTSSLGVSHHIGPTCSPSAPEQGASLSGEHLQLLTATRTLTKP